MSAPLNASVMLLTEHWKLDIMHRRAGGMLAAPAGGRPHGDAHKNCPLGRCGTRPGPYHEGTTRTFPGRSQKITAWRIAKARANRAYLEEFVYAREK
jgi:hypothetical protein